MPITHERGYLIPAFNTEHTDYVACAQRLADSIRQWHPQAHITIVTTDMLPAGDQGGYANDWQVFKVSPYRQTIKLEADMYCASPIDHWWTMFEHRDIVISTGCRDFYDQPSQARHYRQGLDANELADVYNAITYWRMSETAAEFFRWVRYIFQDWASFKTLLKYPEDTPSTDMVYAMAAEIMGRERVTLPQGLSPTVVHMKKHIIPTVTNDWTKELVWEFGDPGLRIQTAAQWGLVHYHIKDWP